MDLRVAGLLMLSVAAVGQTPILHAPDFAVNQDFTFAESVQSKVSTKSSGSGVEFSFPPPSVSEFNGSVSQKVHIKAVNAIGVPVQFSVVYSGKPPENAAADQGNPLGRTFDVDLTQSEPSVTSGDNKGVSENDRRFVGNNARRLVGYLTALKKLSAVNLALGNPAELPAPVVSGLLDIREGELKSATIQLRNQKPTRTFDVRVVVVKQGGEEVAQNGTLAIAADCSSLTASLKSASTREVTMDAAKIRIDAETSLDLSRTLGGQ